MSTYEKRRPFDEMQPFVEVACTEVLVMPESGDLFSPPPERPTLLVAGSVRRKRPDCGDLDLVAVTDEPLTAFEWRGLKVTEKKAFGWLEIDGERVMLDVWRCPPESVGAFMVFLTGPAELNVYVRQRADRRGLMVSQYGVFAREVNAKGKAVPGRRVDEVLPYQAGGATWEHEQAMLATLGLSWLAPHDRDEWRALWLQPS